MTEKNRRVASNQPSAAQKLLSMSLDMAHATSAYGSMEYATMTRGLRAFGWGFILVGPNVEGKGLRRERDCRRSRAGSAARLTAVLGNKVPYLSGNINSAHNKPVHNCSSTNEQYAVH